MKEELALIEAATKKQEEAYAKKKAEVDAEMGKEDSLLESVQAASKASAAQPAPASRAMRSLVIRPVVANG